MYGRQWLWCTIGYAIISNGIGAWEGSLSPMINILAVVTTALFLIVTFVTLPPDDMKRFKKFRCFNDHGDGVLSRRRLFLQDAVIGEKKTLSDRSGMEKMNSLSNNDRESAILKRSTQGCSRENVNSFTAVYKLFTNGDYMFFLFVVLLNGTARGVMTHFYEPFLREVLHSDSLTVGVSAWSGVVFEIIIFFYSKSLLDRFGRVRIMILAQFFMLCRVACYGFLPHDYANAKYMPIMYELFKGMNFGLMQSSGVPFAMELAPKELQSTAQGLFTGIYGGLGPCLAGLFGYFIQNANSSPDTSDHVTQMMFYTAIGSALAFVFVSVKYEFIDKSPRH